MKKNQLEVQKKIGEFNAYLNKVALKVVDQEYQDYSAVIYVTDINEPATAQAGTIWYKPSKGTYRLVTSSKSLMELWDSMNGVDLSGYHIYVDGSHKDGKVSAAYILYQHGKEVHRFGGPVKDTSMNNVGGELAAVLMGLTHCKKNNIFNICVHYDYIGIEKFYTGEWKAKESLTQKYVEMSKEFKDLNITWIHVPGHTGDKGNEEVDKYAFSFVK